MRTKIKNKKKFSFMNIEENVTTLQCQEEAQTIEDNDPFKVRVLIVKVISPNEIYVSEAANTKAFENMLNYMQTFYISNKCDLQYELIPQYYYSVYSQKDKQYLRAQFLEMSVHRSHYARMLLIDLAEVEDISVEHIQPLDSKFMDVLKNMFKVRLAGIKPCGGTSIWQSSSCQKLNEIMHNNGDTKYYITFVVSLKLHQCLIV
jgi:hypothetical protein